MSDKINMSQQDTLSMGAFADIIQSTYCRTQCYLGQLVPILEA